MAEAESDETFCSQIEKETKSRTRRSKRLSQKHSITFSSRYVDPFSQRLNEIHQQIKNKTTSTNWSDNDWLALKFEVESFKNSLDGRLKRKVTLVLKEIDHNLQCSTTCTAFQKQSRTTIPSYTSNIEKDESQKSPNILAGMMPETLTELPPYQPGISNNIMESVRNPKQTANIFAGMMPETLTELPRNSKQTAILTQVAPLDLRNNCNRGPANALRIHKAPTHQIEANSPAKAKVIDISKDSAMDLEENNSAEIPLMVKDVSQTKAKSPIHISKWLKYLPTQERPTLKNLRPINCPLNSNKKTLKKSISNLYNDNLNNPTKSKKLSRSPQKLKDDKKVDITFSIRRQNTNSKTKLLHNTEQPGTRNTLQTNMPQRNFESERMPSPDFFSEELSQIEMPHFSDSASLKSLSPSLKEHFKEAFGTDILHVVFGYEKVIYPFTENHVRRLAKALDIEYNILKTKIELIFDRNSSPSYKDDTSSEPSVVECSQSPPPRLFPSQRSRVSK